MTETLSPCPRCASTDLLDDFELVPADEAGMWTPMAFIQCLACGYLLRRPYRCDVVRAWNASTGHGAGVRGE
jgi:hypothetical protein